MRRAVPINGNAMVNVPVIYGAGLRKIEVFLGLERNDVAEVRESNFLRMGV